MAFEKIERKLAGEHPFGKVTAYAYTLKGAGLLRLKICQSILGDACPKLSRQVTAFAGTGEDFGKFRIELDHKGDHKMARVGNGDPYVTLRVILANPKGFRKEVVKHQFISPTNGALPYLLVEVPTDHFLESI